MDEQLILREAFLLLEEEGLDNFSMRTLMARLGVQAPSLYWHIGSRSNLLSKMSLMIYDDAFAEAKQARDWRTWSRAYGKSLRKAILARRDGARLCAGITPPPDLMEHFERHEPDPHLSRAMDRDRALSHFTGVCALTMGWTLYEQSEGMGEFLGKLLNSEHAFQEMLDAMVAGFDIKLTALRRKKR